jgi:hypothetical protein
MTAWSDLVTKLCRENPGKPLGAILPLAKKMYKGTKKSDQGTKKVLQRMNKKIRRKSQRYRK